MALEPRYFCDEPSAAAGINFLRPAAACRRGKRRRLPGRSFKSDFVREFLTQDTSSPSMNTS